jgi:lysozyme
MNDKEIMNILKQEEGFRSSVYQDHLGFWTIGHGRMVDERRKGGITQEEAEYLLKNDIARTKVEVEKAFPWSKNINSNARTALVLMAFQMGIGKLTNFSRMLNHLKKEEYKEAAKEALNSVWARQQTTSRAKRVAELMTA